LRAPVRSDRLAAFLVSGLWPEVAGIERIVMRDALKVRRIVGVACADIFAALGVGAQRALECDALGRSVVHVMRCNDPLRTNALLHPSLEFLDEVMVRIDHRPVVQ